MKILMSSVFAVLCASGCLGGAPAETDDATQTTIDQDTATGSEAFDDVRAAAIAKAKMAGVDAKAISPPDAACGKTGSNLGNERVNDASSPGAAQQRSGSSTGCPAVGTLQQTDDATYFCFTSHNDGFTWTYLQNLRTGVRGWTRDDLLKPPAGHTLGGSSRFCGF